MASGRAMWTGFALITGVLVGAAAVALSLAGGVPAPLAILTGGAACGGAIAVFIALVRYATGEAG